MFFLPQQINEYFNNEVPILFHFTDSLAEII